MRSDATLDELLLQFYVRQRPFENALPLLESLIERWILFSQQPSFLSFFAKRILKFSPGERLFLPQIKNKERRRQERITQ